MPGVGTLDELHHAVDRVDVDELTVDVESSALEAARRSLDRSGLLLLGEVHGVRENPLLVHALLAALDADGLGLEWDEDLAPIMAAFAAGAPLTDHPWLWSGDGRITAGHLALLRTRAAAGRPPPLLFDGAVDAGASWSQRDRAMAERILAGDADGPRLVVAGNLHTRLRRTRSGVPMGGHLQKARPGVREIRIIYRRGAYYNGGPSEFPARRRSRAASPAGASPLLRPLLREDAGQVLLDLPQATEAVVPHRPLPRPGPYAEPFQDVGMIRLEDLPVSGPAPHVDADRVDALLPIFDSLPPITVFVTPHGLLVADGYHRIAAARRLGRTWIAVDVRRGTEQEALAFAVENARRERGVSSSEARNAIDRWSRRRP